LSVASDIEVFNAHVARGCLGTIKKPLQRSLMHPKKVVEPTLLKVEEEIPAKKLSIL